ncbi:hypothetical protein NQ318_017204 [Aromia moschata]|uniref:Uncharacterized protein n=1 Tax=Aromia moschata TaxID=1265417 RepID=A0AAV8YN24_9CUCU|nr:hypothetical protein NQ318_017204 [Aromia moschata]
MDISISNDGSLHGVRQGMSGAGAGHDSMRDVGGRQLRRRTPVVQEATAPNPNSNSQPNRGVDDTRRAEDYEAPLPQGSPAVRRRAARRREDTRRLRWTVKMNIEVMRTFYIINHCRDEPLPGWRHSLHAEFLRRNPTFNISEQNVVDRKNVIVRKRYLTDLQLQEVKREVGQILYQQEEFQNLPEVYYLYYIISSANSILQQYLDGTNDLQKAHLGVYCASALILELNGQQVYTPNPNRKNKDSDTPMWKKRLEKNIDEYRADADVLSEFLAGNNSRRVMAKTQAIARKAQIDLNNADHRQQLLNLKDLLRQKAKAKGARLRRYNKLTKRKQQNAAFENTQKQFLRSLEKQDEEQPAEIDPQYRYLGVCQDGRMNHTQLKKEFQEKYKTRVTKFLNTLLSGGNLIKAINSWAVPVLTYSFGIVKWSITDLDELDRLTRRLLTKFRRLHTNSSVIRLYLSRRRGGRGLLNIKNQCLYQEASLRRKLLTNRDPLITAVAREDASYTPLSLGCELIPVDRRIPIPQQKDPAEPKKKKQSTHSRPEKSSLCERTTEGTPGEAPGSRRREQDFNDPVDCDDHYTANNHESYEYNSANDESNYNYPIDVDSNYQDFHSLPSEDNPPGYAYHSMNQLSEIQSQFKTLNLNEFHPDLNFPEQTFL